MRLPPLPHGPLSVRSFHLEACDGEGGPYRRASHTLTTLDTAATQRWCIRPPIEARRVRIVCETNAAAAAEEARRRTHPAMLELEQHAAMLELEEHASCCGFFWVEFSCDLG